MRKSGAEIVNFVTEFFFPFFCALYMKVTIIQRHIQPPLKGAEKMGVRKGKRGERKNYIRKK